MLVRDPAQLYERHGRQLLVAGVQFDGQQALFALGASIAADASELCTIAAEVAGRYLVGAGLGRLVAPSQWAQAVTRIDPELQLALRPADLALPCVHIHLRQRGHGAEAELAWLGEQPRSCLFVLRSFAGLTDAVALGGAVAQLVIDDVLGLAPLPALVVVDLRDPINPMRFVELPQHRLGGDPASQPWRPALETACRAAWPSEAAGTLVFGSGGTVNVRVAPSTHSSEHFELPSEFLGDSVLAIWHSHPSGSTALSAADTAWGSRDPGPRPLQLILAMDSSGIADFGIHYFSERAGRWLSEAP